MTTEIAIKNGMDTLIAYPKRYDHLYATKMRYSLKLKPLMIKLSRIKTKLTPKSFNELFIRDWSIYTKKHSSYLMVS